MIPTDQRKARSIHKRSTRSPGICGEELILVRWGHAVRKIKLAELENCWGNAYVLDILPLSDRIRWARVIGFRCIRDHANWIRIRTRCRREVTITPRQSCLRASDDGVVEVIQPKEYVPGHSLVPLARTIPGPYPECWIPEEESLLSPYNRPPIYQITDFPLTRSFGFFAGRYLANGYIDKESLVEIACIHPALTEMTVSVATKLGLRPYVTRAKIRISSVQLARILAGEFGTGTAKKHIPGWVFGASPAFREGLLDGYWSSAWISEDGMQMKACTDSKELGFDMQALLLSRGIQSSCRERHYKRKHSPIDKHYIVELAASSIGSMPLLTHPERRACQSRWHPPRKDTLCVLPIPQKLVKGRLRDKSSKGFGGFSFVSREATHPKHLEMISGDLMWDVVESVEEDLTSRTLCQIQLQESAIPVLFSGIGLVGHLSINL